MFPCNLKLHWTHIHRFFTTKSLVLRLKHFFPCCVEHSELEMLGWSSKHVWFIRLINLFNFIKKNVLLCDPNFHWKCFRNDCVSNRPITLWFSSMNFKKWWRKQSHDDVMVCGKTLTSQRHKHVTSMKEMYFLTGKS